MDTVVASLREHDASKQDVKDFIEGVMMKLYRWMGEERESSVWKIPNFTLQNGTGVQDDHYLVESFT